jgi:DNA-directed RNA polymerase specialized sigma24 family protein
LVHEKPDDASLLTAAAGGDRRAFERIYLEYKDDLLTLAALMLGDRQAAEDVLHDVFVSLARRSCGDEPVAAVLPGLYRWS